MFNISSVKKLLPSTIILALTVALAFHGAVAASTVNLTIVGPVTVDPANIKNPGSSANNFRPSVASVAQGGSVVWTNLGSENHTVTSYTGKMTVSLEGFNVTVPIPDGQFDSLNTIGPIAHLQSFTLDTSQLKPGTYHYFCQFHPWMQALLNVKAPSSNAPSTTKISIDHTLGQTTQFFAGSASWGFLPRDITVKKGSQIVVTNTAVIPHTFTSYTSTVQFVIGGRLLTFPVPDGVWDSLTVDPNGIPPNGSYTLDTSNLNPGTYHYFCDFHDWMQGTLTIT